MLETGIFWLPIGLLVFVLLTILLVNANRLVAAAKFYREFFKNANNSKWIGDCFHGSFEGKWVGGFNYPNTKLFIALECSLPESFILETPNRKEQATSVKESFNKLEFGNHTLLTNNLAITKKILSQAPDCLENLFQLKCYYFELCPAKRMWAIQCPSSLWVKIIHSDWYPDFPDPKTILLELSKLAIVLETGLG